MNDRGFTLIELTAVIVVLVAIFLVSFPSILNTIRSDKEKQYNDMVENLCLAGKTYIYSNMDNFPELSISGSNFELTIKTLVDYGTVDKNLVNVKNDKSVVQDSLTYTVLSDYSLKCEYNEK